MKKRLLSLALCLALCLGLFPFGALAANGSGVYEGTGDPEAASVISVNGTTTNYATLPAALNAAQNGDTVKLLANHTTDWDAVYASEEQMAVVKTRITLDLNGNTVDYLVVGEVVPDEGVGIIDDGNLTVKSSLSGGTAMEGQITTLKFVKGTLSVQDGVVIGSSSSSPSGLICEAGSGTVTISGGMVYNAKVGKGAAVTVSGGLLHQGQWINNGTLNITGGTFGWVKFYNNSGTIAISGGTFGSLQNLDNDSSQIAPMSLLAPGHAFYERYNENTVKDGSSRDFLQDVTVKEHTHTMVINKCACGYTCPHTSVDESGACTVCGKQFAASITEGDAVTYYDTFSNALVYASKNDGCTLKLLANVESAVSIEVPLIFDLNGHNVQGLSVCAKVTVRDSSTEKGNIRKVLIFDKYDEETNLTLGDLLEEGYGFKHENGIWADDSHKETISGLKVTVEEAPIKRVVLDAIGADNKKVSTTMAYGTTGAVTLEASCWINDMNTPTYTWYKLEGAAATAPMDGVNGVKYKLPDDLPAGKHTYLVTCTSDGYSKSAEITITVEKANLSKAEITFPDGNEAAFNYVTATGVPTFVVTYKGQTLEKDVDFTITKGSSTYAVGPCTLTIKATDKGDYTGSKSAEWTVRPLKVAASVGDIIKTYDGTTNLPKDTKITFKSADSYYTGTTLRLAKGTDYEVFNACYDSADASETEKTISFTIKLKNEGYVFEDGTKEKAFTLKGSETDKTFKITKAAAPTMQPIELTVINGLAKTYLVNLPALPTLGDNCKYGSIKYEACNFDLIGEGGYANSTAMITSNDEFQLTVPAVESQTEGSVGTVGVKITTDNYQDMLLTVEVIAKNKIVPVLDGEITATPITFGQILRVSTITGTMKDDGKTVEGTFEWTDPSTKPDKAGDYQAEWTFTPAEGYEEYATATGTVTIKVNKATPTFTAPTARENLTYTGQEQALITAGMTDYGTMQYSLTENGTYSQNIPTGTDAGAYTVWYRVIGDANHNDTAPASVAVSIRQKPLTITGVTAASKPYDGTTDAGITSVTFDGVNLNRGTDYTVTASFDDASAGNVKNITATVTLMDQAAKNYALEQSNFSATGSITKAAPTYTPPTANDLTYNGTAQELFKAGTTQDGTMLYSMSKTSDFLPNVPLIRKAGTYTFYYQVRGDGNHTDSDIGTITVTIKKAPLTITAKDKSAYVGSTAPDLSNPELNKDYTVSGLFGRDLLTKSPVLSYATEKPDMSQVGSVDINISDADAGRNYTITYVSGKLNITTRPSSSGSSNSGTKTDTVKNPDGSTTKTETKADGSKTETTTASSGGGSTGTTVTKTDAKGNTTTEASAKLSDRDVKEAQEKGEAVSVPVKGIAAAKDANAATKIKIDVPNNANKTTVEIPVENVTSGTVAVIVHEDGTEELVKDSKPTEGGVQLELSGSTTVKIIDNSKTFDDTKDHWSRDEVNFVAARELFNGVGGNQFGVSQPMTRGMVNTVLARLAGVDTTPGQGQAWYEVGTDWAKKNGISDGTNPTAPVTREQLATLLYRYAGSPSVSGTLHAADAASVSDYAEDALLWANQNGIVNGVGSNTIAPKDNAQRAQVAAMLARYLQNQ